MPSISIITPSYNGRGYIESCIKNVIAQNCAAAEHVIVDGGSIDGTVEIIRRYAEKYSHICWISEPDQGQSDAMNKGIAMARGKILGFLNVDDFYEQNVVNRVLGIFETLPDPSLLVGNCNIWDSEGRLLSINKPRNLRLSDLLLGSAINPHPINPSAYFYHKSLHQEIGLYNITEHYALDLDFLLRAVQVANLKYVDEIWGNFNMVEGSKTVRDSRTEQGIYRSRTMLKEYRDDLSFPQKLWISVGFAIFNNPIVSPIIYFLKHSEELPWRFKARTAKIFRLEK